MNIKMKLLALVLLSLLVIKQAFSKDKLVVYAADLISFNGKMIRIANIDVPSLFSYKCEAELELAKVARDRLIELLSPGKATLFLNDPVNGLSPAAVEVNGVDIGDVLIDEGLARPWLGKHESWCES